MYDLFAQLEKIARRKKDNNPLPMIISNKTYHLCMEERFISLLISMWMDAGKPFPLSIRDAAKNVYGSIVVTIQDKDGEQLSFIEKLITTCNPKIVIR